MKKYWTVTHAVLTLGVALCAEPPNSEPRPAYEGQMRLPLALSSDDGSQLKAGVYQVSVRREGSAWQLIFSSGDTKFILKQHVTSDSEGKADLQPLVGTHYLRPSNAPVLSAEERHHSKTGRAQYEDEARDWRATLRAYTTSGNESVLFIFQERMPNRRWSRIDFHLRLASTTKQ